MAIKQTNANRDFDTAEFVIDAPADVDDLPTNIGWGSTALCIETGNIYIFDSNSEWVIIGGTSS